jgi:predicted enzyme related to lactoylglutathione lyase
MAVIRLQEVVVDCHDPTTLVRFWAELFGTEAVVRDQTWAYVDSPETGVRIAFQRVPESKSVKNRVHLDVEVDDIPCETERCTHHGARPTGSVMEDDYGQFQVMLDPEGNEFCLVD